MISQKKYLFEKVKITYIGAGGKIGQHALAILCASLKPNYQIEMTLLGSGSPESLENLEKISNDLNGILYSNHTEENMTFNITNDYQKITGSSLIICSAGKDPAKAKDEKSNEIRKSDPTGRIIQSYINKNLIINIAMEVNKYCPGSLMIICTNQVDHMCYIARKVAPNVNVLGLSGAVDSPRLRNIIFNKYGVHCQGFIIGHHSNNMFPLLNSIKTKENNLLFPSLCKENGSSSGDNIEFNNEKNELSQIMDEVKKMGNQIFLEQREGLKDAKATGASKLPAMAVVKVIKAYCFNEEFTECWNVCVKGRENAEYYGIQEGDEVSVPVIIKKKQVSISTEIPIMQEEKNELNSLKKKLKDEMEYFQINN